MKAAARWGAVLEAMAVFLLLMFYIWDLRFTHPGFWLAIPGSMLISHAVRREDADSLGFRWKNMEESCRRWAPPLVLLGLALLGTGILLNTVRPMAIDQAVLAWAAYLPWGLAQQYALNGYFLNRLDTRVSPRTAPIISAALFSGAHTPNLFLMAVTLLAGYLSALAYRRQRNLYFLGLAHATVGFLLFLVVPDSISHHLSVGPGCYRH